MTRGALKKAEADAEALKEFNSKIAFFEPIAMQLEFENTTSTTTAALSASELDRSSHKLKRSKSAGALANRKKPRNAAHQQPPPTMEMRARKNVQQEQATVNNGKKRKAESSLNNRGMEVEDKGAIGFQKKKLKKNEVQRPVTDPKVTIILSKYTTTTNKIPSTPTISSLNKQQTPKSKPTTTIVNNKKQPTVVNKEEAPVPAPVLIPKRVTRARNVEIKPIKK